MSISEARIRRVFDIFDYNHRGVITLDELERLLRAFGLADASKQVVAGFMRTTVGTGSSVNEVTFEDTRRMLQQNYTSGNTEEIWAVYKLLDRAGRGRLNSQDLVDAARKTNCFESYMKKPVKKEGLTRGSESPKKSESAPPSPSATAADDECAALPEMMNGKLRLPPGGSAKKQQRFAQFVQAAAEYPDKGITFEEWRKVQIKVHEELEEMELQQQTTQGASSARHGNQNLSRRLSNVTATSRNDDLMTTASGNTNKDRRTRD